MHLAAITGVRFLPFLALLASVPASAQAPEFMPGELIIRWRSVGHARTTARNLSRVGLRAVRAARAVSEDTWVYQLDERSREGTLDALREAQATLGDALVVELNTVRTPFRLPNDPRYPFQWHLKSTRVEQAWDRTTGATNIVVAVVDTGILPKHPDLESKLVPGGDFVSDATGAADGNGWDPDPTDPGNESLSSSGYHGTHVAGIIGAAANNAKGIAGVSWGARILPVRALGVNKGVGSDADIAAAIRWAAGLPVDGVPQNPNPAKVINLSFGGPGYNQTLDDAVQAAIGRGAIVVAAAGNQGDSTKNIYPAALKNVITVGASTIDGKRASYSNYGPEVEVMAPGGDLGGILNHLPQDCNGLYCPAGILSTLYDSGQKQFSYQFYEGTSQAAPIVAGVVALMLSGKANLSAGQATDILRATAEGYGTCAEGCGAGMVNAEAALTMVATGQAPGNKGAQGTGPTTVMGVGCSLAAGASGDGLPLVLVLIALLCCLRRSRGTSAVSCR
jgi:serine protease